MFCFQCQEAARNVGCTIKGVCGKTPETSDLQDVLIQFCQEAAVRWKADRQGTREIAQEITRALFMTITNANFDNQALAKAIQQIAHRMDHPAQDWTLEQFLRMPHAGILEDADEDVRSLRQLAVIGLKGLSAYLHHAAMLGYEQENIYANFLSLLADTETLHEVPLLQRLVLDVGSLGVQGMALLDKANTETYGDPEVTKVRLGVGNRPGILVSGHDLRDLEELLEQTSDKGIDIYTHSEMLPAHYYPRLKRFTHLYGNYGSSWWEQERDFEQFNGPVLLTTNCLVPPKSSYKERVFTTGAAGFEGCRHIPDREGSKPKDFSPIIEMALRCPPPKPLEDGNLVGGFAHRTLESAAPQILQAVTSGAITKFVVMAGCDGRMKNRTYYTDFAKSLPGNTIILTAGCAKYRYNKLDLGSIGAFPRVLDAGQCNDSYSLALIAVKLKEALGLDDINKLPIVYNIAWYEQKAVIVLLALLALGVKNIRIGPTLPAFLSPNVSRILVETFGLGSIQDVEHDMAALIG